MEGRRIKCCDVSLHFLRLCQLFPEEGQQSSMSRHVISIGIFLGSVSLMITLLVIHITTSLKRNYGIEAVFFGVVCLVSLSGVIWIDVLCIKNRHVLFTLADAISDFKTYGLPADCETFRRKLDTLSRLHLLYLVSGCFTYFAVFAPMHHKNCILINAKRNITVPCSLLVPIYVPFVNETTLDQFPANVAINCLQMLLLIYMYTTCGTVVWINLEMVEYIRMRIRHLKGKLIGAFHETDRIERKKRFREAFKYHQDILRMGRLADRFFGIELFLHVILTGAILGVSAYVMINTQSCEVFMVFLGWLNAIIMGCVSGQRLLDESTSIPDVMYEVNWYLLDEELKKDVAIFLLRCSRPLYIQAGNVVMTNQLIIRILRTAYSYTTFLSSINNI